MSKRHVSGLVALIDEFCYTKHRSLETWIIDLLAFLFGGIRVLVLYGNFIRH